MRISIKYRVLQVVCPLIFFSISACDEHATVTITDAPAHQICELEENLAPIGEPFSFAIADDGDFVLTDFKTVFLYSADGRQIKQIGNPGRAKFEYLNPGCVKIHESTIYVWSANSLKFITYTMSGEPIAEYQYGSSLRDFLPDGKKIYIYTSGNADQHVIDIYDLTEKKVVESMTRTSPEHRALLNVWASAPMFIMGDTFYYSLKDALNVYCHDSKTNGQREYADVNSDVFSVEKLRDEESVLSDKNKRTDYLWGNSMTLILFTDSNGDLLLLTADGKISRNGGNYDYSDRFYTLYNVAKDSIIAEYSHASIKTLSLFSSNSDGLYFLKLSDDETQPHTLQKLIL